MKLNNFFVMGATALAMTSGSVYAADEALADAIWSGVIGGSVPSSNLIITGEAGGDIQRGSLYVNTDGTFTSSKAVSLVKLNPEGATDTSPSWLIN